MAEPFESRQAAPLRDLAPKAKPPASASILNTWIAQAERRLDSETDRGRLGWLIASSVAVAAVQRAVDSEGHQLFLLKGGTLLQHRLHLTARATRDIDGLIRGDIDAFLLALEAVLAAPWGPLTLRRGPVDVINVATRIAKPRRFDIYLELRGVTWRRIQFEIAADEARIGDASELIEAPLLAGFGLPDPDALVGIALRHQIAQKLHAVTDPHDPPLSLNDRARDVVDLMLLRDLAAETDSPTLGEINDAATAVFQSRAAEALQLGLTPRGWPAEVTAHPHWADDYQRAAASASLALPLGEAVDQVNGWIAAISRS